MNVIKTIEINKIGKNLETKDGKLDSKVNTL